jgi:1-phosphofructokinase
MDHITKWEGKRLITTVGLNLSIDRTIEVERLVPYGTNRALSTRSDPGGKAVNVALMAARLGAIAAITGFMRQENARFFGDKLEAGGVKADFAMLPGSMRVNVKVLDREAGAVTEFNESGAPVSPEDLETIVERVRRQAASGGWLVLTGSLPPGCPKDFYLRLIRSAQGCRVALDADGEALALALEGKPQLVKPNRRELEGLTGRSMDSIDDVRRGALELIDRGVEIVVVSLGDKGALAALRGECLFAEPPEVAVRSTVGAGDAMVAGLTVALEAGETLETALRTAVAAAGAAVATPGTQAAPLTVYQHIYRTISIQKVM